MPTGLESTKQGRGPRRWVLVAVIAFVVWGLLMVVGAYAWDHANENKIAEGVSVEGIDLGGKSADSAKVILNKNLVKPLQKPVTVTFEGKSYTLTPQQLKTHADTNAMVDEAVAASRDGGLPTRLWRYATGGDVDRTISPRISYSTTALDAFIKGLQGKIDRDPVDATVKPTPTSLLPEKPQDGVALQTDALRSKLMAAIQSPDTRSVQATVTKTKPTVTEAQLAQKYPSYIVIDRTGFKLRLFQNLKLTNTYTIAVGQVGLETPAGEYNIQDKQVDPSWHVPDSAWAGDLAGQTIPPGPADPLKARWMGLVDGAGIHGTDELDSLGSAASHGCIRMSIPDVEALYDKVDVGTPVYIF